MKGDERDERKAVSRKRTNLSYRNESLPTARRSSARRAPRWSPRRRRRRPRPRRCRPRPRPRFAEPEGCTCIETHVQPGTGSELASGNILLRAQAQAQGWGGRMPRNFELILPGSDGEVHDRLVFTWLAGQFLWDLEFLRGAAGPRGRCEQ